MEEKERITQAVVEAFRHPEIKEALNIASERATKDAFKDSVHQMLITLGIDSKEPLKMQSRIHFIDQQMTRKENHTTWIERTAIGGAVMGILYAIWNNIKSF